jgi:hypothetical protein
VVRVLGRAVVVAGVSTLALAAAAVSPDTARAQVETPFQSLRANPGTSAYLDDFYSKILHDTERSQGWNSSVNSATTGQKNVIYRQVNVARVNARLLPASSLWLTRITLAGVGAYIGYKIYQEFTGGTEEVDVWLDSSKLGADALFNPCAVPFGGNKGPPCIIGWQRENAGSCDTKTQAFNTGETCVAGAAWMLHGSTSNTNGGCSTAQGGPGQPCYVLHLMPVATQADAQTWSGVLGGSGTAGNCADNPGVFTSCWYAYSEWDATSNLANWPGTDSQAGYDSIYPQQLAYALEQTWLNIANRVGVSPTIVAQNPFIASLKKYRVFLPSGDPWLGVGATSGQGDAGDVQGEYEYTVPPEYGEKGDVGSEADTESALDPFDNPCGQAFVNWVLDPGTYSFDPGNCGGWTNVATFPLVQPLVNETYPDYLDRLRALGWLGSATSTVAAEGDTLPQMGPQGIVRLRIGQNTYRPTAWPSPAPQWNVNVDVSVTYNPADLPEAPGGGEPLPPGSGGTGVPVPPAGPLGDWCEACPPVDFSPLTDAPLGESFPFGVVPWLGEYVGSLTTTPDAPVFSFDFSSFEAGSFGPYNLGTYEVDLDVLDAYMSIIRTILSWCIWIGGVWYFGSRLLGFRETGDPGAAVDEAW